MVKVRQEEEVAEPVHNLKEKNIFKILFNKNEGEK